MEIPWKMQRTSYLIFIISVGLFALASSTPIPDASEEPVALADEKKEDKRDGDLDLETQDQVAILKQINRVNEDGSYTFGYEAADGSFKIETRDVNGNVKGMFGFINEDGELKRVSYSASNGTGFQTTGAFNVPPLPGTRLSAEDEADGRYPPIPIKLIPQRLYPNGQDTSTRIDLLPPSTTTYDDRTTELIPTPRLPIYIFSTTPTVADITTTLRPVVIQHIPKVRPTPVAGSAETTEPEEIDGKTTFDGHLPRKTSNTNYVTLKSNDVTTEAAEDEETTRKPSVIQVIRPKTGPYKKVIVTKRPIIETTTATPKTVTTTEFISKDYIQRLKENSLNQANGVRRQLDFDDGNNNNPTTPENTNLVTSGTEDSPDVYGATGTPRPYTTVAYRTLFTQIPQHQRILQNSYVQNQNQYLAAAAFPPGGIPPGVNPLPAGQVPQVPNAARVLPPPQVLPQNIATPNAFTPRPATQRLNNETPSPFPIPSQPLNRVVPNAIPIQPNYISPPPLQPAYANPMPLQPSPYDRDPYGSQIYIPPGLLENLIRMLLSVRERQLAYAQQMISPVNPRPIPPDMVDRYGPYPQPAIPYPNYSHGSYPIPVQYIPRTTYDPRFADPRLMMPFPGPYAGVPSIYEDPRVGPYQTPYRPILYGPFQGRLPPQANQDPRLLNGVLGGRPPILTPQLPKVASPVERSVPYGQRIPDSTTSSTTSAPRVGSVRNVQILSSANDDSEESEKFQRDVKS